MKTTDGLKKKLNKRWRKKRCVMSKRNINKNLRMEQMN